MAKNNRDAPTQPGPAERAKEALRGAHTLCMERTGFSYLCDIPTQVETAVLSDKQVLNEPPRLAVSRLKISPDAARLVSPYALTDERLEEIKNSKDAVSEGVGAQRIYDLMNRRVGQAAPPQRKPVRYSLNGRHDLQLLRHYLWREGYSWKDTEQGVRIIDVSHAVSIVSALQRSVGSDQTPMCPKEFADFDRDPRPLNASELCETYGVRASNNQAASLLRLVFAAREAEYDDKAAPSLRALGGVLDHLEGVAGILPEPHLTGAAKERARRLISAARPGVLLDPGQVGLLLEASGKWVPVVHVAQGAARGASSWLYAIPEGRSVSGYTFMSRPLMRCDWLYMPGGKKWEPACDDRLRALTDHEGEPGYTFESLSKAYKTHGNDWPQPDGYTGGSIKENAWTQIYDGWPTSDNYAEAYKLTGQINRHNEDKVLNGLDHLAVSAKSEAGRARKGASILVENLKICASRADVVGDGRARWLQQISKQIDADSWPGAVPVDPETVTEIMVGEGAVAKHNRTAIAARHALRGGATLPNSPAAAVSAAPAPRV